MERERALRSPNQIKRNPFNDRKLAENGVTEHSLYRLPFGNYYQTEHNGFQPISPTLSVDQLRQGAWPKSSSSNNLGAREWYAVWFGLFPKNTNLLLGSPRSPTRNSLQTVPVAGQVRRCQLIYIYTQVSPVRATQRRGIRDLWAASRVAFLDWNALANDEPVASDPRTRRRKPTLQ